MRSGCSTPRGECLSSEGACLGGEEDQFGMLKQRCGNGILKEGGTFASSEKT